MFHSLTFVLTLTFHHVGRVSFGSGRLNVCCAQRARRAIRYRVIVICATRMTSSMHVAFEHHSLPFDVSTPSQSM